MLVPLDNFFSKMRSSLVLLLSNVPDKDSRFPTTMVLFFSLYVVVKHSFSFLKQNVIFLLLIVKE